MIRKLLLSSVTLVVISGTAFAADLPSRRAPPVYIPPPIPVFSWTGAYVGAQVGYAFGRDNATLFATNGAGSAGIGSSPNGIIGGAHVGYNFSTQSLPVFSGFLGTGGVFGIEGDVDGSDYRRTTIFSNAFGERIGNTIQGSIRGRLGIAVDRALFYATGGAAFASFNTNYVTNGFGEAYSHTRVGYTVGGGVEYAITNNFSLRGEYRYSDFGTFTDTLVGSAGTLAVRRKETEQRAQVGFSYKFDTFSPIAPVVARY